MNHSAQVKWGLMREPLRRLTLRTQDRIHSPKGLWAKVVIAHQPKNSPNPALKGSGKPR